MPQWIKPRLLFIREAILSEIKRNRWYQIMIIASALSTIITFIGLFIPIHIPLPDWSWKGWLIAFFCAVIILLLLILEAIFRFHFNIIKKHQSAIAVLDDKYQRELKELQNRAYRYTDFSVTLAICRTLLSDLDSDEQPLREQKLAAWRSDATNTIAIHDGSEVAMQFSGNDPYVPPDSVVEQREWLYGYMKKLGALLASK